MEQFEKPQIISHAEKNLNYTVFGVKWMPCSAKVVVLGSHPRDTGALQLYELSKGQLNLILEVGVLQLEIYYLRGIMFLYSHDHSLKKSILSNVVHLEHQVSTREG